MSYSLTTFRSGPLRSMLHFIAEDLGIEDPASATNPVTLTREIREAIEKLRFPDGRPPEPDDIEPGEHTPF